MPASTQAGETGTAEIRSHETAGLRTRRVDYGPGYLADHWCDLGHAAYVLAGEITIDLRDGRSHRLGPGMGFQVSDHGDAAHRLRTDTGARLLIID